MVDDHDILEIRRFAKNFSTHYDHGVQVVANDVLTLDQLCQRLARALNAARPHLKDETLADAASALFAYEELYDV